MIRSGYKRDDAFWLGHAAIALSDNPFWQEYPKPSAKGQEDQDLGWAFIEGFVAKVCEERKRSSNRRK